MLLALYAHPYDAQFPVVCFDERPYFLLGDVVEGLASEPGKPAKAHYAHTKHGSCCVLATVDPSSGSTSTSIRCGPGAPSASIPKFRQQLAARYPQASKIRLVQDDLSPNMSSTFHSCLPAAIAQRLAARFEVCYTSGCNSQLNQVELDFLAPAR